MEKEYIIKLEDDVFKNDLGDEVYRVEGFNSLIFDRMGLDRLQSFREKYEEAATSSFTEGHNKGYEEGYDKGYSEGYQDGLEQDKKRCEQLYKDISSRAHDVEDMDGTEEYYYDLGISVMWNAVRRIILPPDEGPSNSVHLHVAELFGKGNGWNIRNIFKDMDPHDVIATIKTYDDKINSGSVKVESSSPKIGDQVKLNDEGVVGVIFGMNDTHVLGYFYPDNALQPVPFCLPRDSVILTGEHTDVSNFLDMMKNS